jgi:hypothetical protein
MRKATKEDRERAIDILYKAYKDNPTFTWVVKESKPQQFEERVKYLCGFLFDSILLIGGVYMTSFNDGICMIYNSKAKKSFISSWILQIGLALKVVGISRSLEIMKRESHIEKLRPQGEYLYFWVLAADPDVKGYQDMAEIRDETFEMSKNLNLPIYAETTVERNINMYKRYGFEEYNTWHVPNKDVTIHFMKRDPNYTSERNK